MAPNTEETVGVDGVAEGAAAGTLEVIVLVTAVLIADKVPILETANEETIYVPAGATIVFVPAEKKDNAAFDESKGAPLIYTSTLSKLVSAAPVDVLPFHVISRYPAVLFATVKVDGTFGKLSAAVEYVLATDHGPKEPSSYFHLNCSGYAVLMFKSVITRLK